MTDDEGTYRIDVPVEWARRNDPRHEIWAAASRYQLNVAMLPSLNEKAENWTGDALTLTLAHASDVTMRIVASDAVRPENGTPQVDGCWSHRNNS